MIGLGGWVGGLMVVPFGVSVGLLTYPRVGLLVCVGYVYLGLSLLK